MSRRHVHPGISRSSELHVIPHPPKLSRKAAEKAEKYRQLQSAKSKDLIPQSAREVEREANKSAGRFHPQAMKHASLVNPNNSSVEVTTRTFFDSSSDYCYISSLYGCTDVEVRMIMAVALFVVRFGIDLQSTKKMVKNSKGNGHHEENAANEITTEYARRNLRDPSTYLSFFNKSMPLFFKASSTLVPFAFTTAQYKNLYAGVLGSDIPSDALIVMQNGLTNIIMQSIVEGAKKSAQLYGLLALIVIPIAGIGYCVYRCKKQAGRNYGPNEPAGYNMRNLSLPQP